MVQKYTFSKWQPFDGREIETVAQRLVVSAVVFFLTDDGCRRCRRNLCSRDTHEEV